MKKLFGILCGIVVFLSAAAAVLYVLKKKGIIDIECPRFDEKEPEGCACVCGEEQPEAFNEEDAPFEPAPEPEKEPPKEPVMKSGFSAQDFKI